jgi:hypothetical protein
MNTAIYHKERAECAGIFVLHLSHRAHMIQDPLAAAVAEPRRYTFRERSGSRFLHAIQRA